eukprot:scaffold240585_cov37-Tisochrysis_lutea.AAC.2
MCLGGIFKIGALHDGIDGAGLLAESTIDALGHVNVIPSGATGAIRPDFSLNGNCLSRANGLTKLASDAALVTGRVATEGVLASESGAKRSFLHRVVERHFLLPEHGERQAHSSCQLSDPDRLHSACEYRVQSGGAGILVTRGLSIRGGMPPPILQGEEERSRLLRHQQVLLQLLRRLRVALSRPR